MVKKKAKVGWKAMLRVRLRKKDAHYSGGLVAGARILELFGDAATQLCLREAGVEGLFRAYEVVDFLAPVYMGDTVQVTATITRVGHTSRRIKFIAFKTKPKELVCRAVGTVVIPELCQPR